MIKEIINYTGKSIKLFFDTEDGHSDGSITIPNSDYRLGTLRTFTKVEEFNGKRLPLDKIMWKFLQLPDPVEGRIYILEEQFAKHLCTARRDVYYVSEDNAITDDSDFVVGYKALNHLTLTMYKTPTSDEN